MSTTLKKDLALQFAKNVIFEIIVKKEVLKKEEHLKEFDWNKEIHAQNAMLVENITDVKGEEEILFPSGIKFYI